MRYLLALALLLVGCFHAPIVPVKSTAPTVYRPCLAATPPERAKLSLLAPVAETHFEGDEQGVVLSVTKESLGAFFLYIEALEKIAQRATACHE